MTSDIEVPASHEQDPATREKRPSGEQTMRTFIKSVAVSVPLAVAFFVGLVSLAIHNQQPDWTVWLSMAAGIGVIAGTFFGMLAGFVLSSHLFE